MKGLYRKFNVMRRDRTPLPVTAEFFPLRLDEHGDTSETTAARSAALHYARLMGDQQLASDILAKFPVRQRSTFKPLGGRVLVLPEIGEETSAGGIILLDDTRKEQASQFARVTALGTGAFTVDKKTGKATPRPFNVKIGDRVITSKYGGADVTIAGKAYKLFDEDEILAVLEG